MKKKRKELLTIILCFLLIVGIIPVDTMAIEFNTADQSVTIQVEQGSERTISTKVNNFIKNYVSSTSGKCYTEATVDNYVEILKGISIWNKFTSAEQQQVNKLISSTGKVTYKKLYSAAEKIRKQRIQSEDGNLGSIPMTATGKASSIQLKWTKVKGADGYYVYANRCNKTDKRYKWKCVKTITSGNTVTYTHKNLFKNIGYKYRVGAYANINGKKVLIARSLILHSYTTGNSPKYKNPSKVTVSNTKVFLEVGKSQKVTAKVSNYTKGKKISNHVVKIRYIVSDSAVASVSLNGTIKAKKSGTCSIWACAQNGVRKEIKVTVISIVQTSAEKKLKVGQSEKISKYIICLPKSIQSTMSYISSNSNVLKVEGNKIIAVKSGKAVITAKEKSGITKKFSFTVVKEKPKASYTVVFNSQGGSKVKSQKVKEGNLASKPYDPVLDGYVFKGWYKEPEGMNEFNFDSPITENITVYAVWEIPDSYTVTFNGNNGTEIKTQTVKKGELASIPDEPVKDGYMFAGWYEEKNMNDWAAVFSFDTPIDKDLTLNAVWVDMNTDTDNDGLSDDIENYIGTKKDIKDTDKDGIDDYKEKILFRYDPTKMDTDNNGIGDGEEDHDGDGLTNIWELENGTNPILKDSDNDGLNDYEEIYNYNIEPTNKDTDGDKVSDGDEVRLGTNPLVAEEQFLENMSFGEVTENLSVTVDVEAVLDGEQVGSMEVTPVTSAVNPVLSPTIPGYLGQGYNISVDNQPKSAVLTFRYDTSLGTIGEKFQPRIYYCNEETKKLEELPNQEVSDGQVRVEVEHFSTYILLNKVEFDKVWENEIKPPDGDFENKVLDIMFVIDYSKSMEDNDPNQLCKKVSKEFITKLRDGIDRAGVVEFIKEATLLSPLTTDKKTLEEAIEGIVYDNGYNSNSGTDGSVGIHTALEQLTSSESSYKYIVFLTDGEDNGYSYSYDDLIASAVASNINIYTVGMGSASETILKKVADSTGGKYYHATTAVDVDDVLNLDDVFKEIESETIDYTTDSNNDGISDYYTEKIKAGELPLSNGSLEFMGIDFNYNENGELSNDYDGDGVKNGDELRIEQNGDDVYMYMISDPMMEYSDADIYSDYIEHQNGTDPMICTYVSSSVEYPWEDNNFTYVSVYNGEDEFWNEIARQIFSTVTFNWSHEEEAKSLITEFFENYSNLDEIKVTTDNVSVEIADMMVQDSIGKAVKQCKDLKMTMGDLVSFTQGMKKWVSAGHSAKNLSPNRITQLKAQIGLLNHKYKFKTISSWDKAGMGISFAISEVEDIGNWIKTYSAITVTQSAFYESKDILKKIKDNDNAKEKFVTRAAEDILFLINQEYSKFEIEKSNDLMMATTENIASLGLSILSTLNPYILAIRLVIDALSLTPASQIAENSYLLYVIDELVIATKDLFIYESKTNSYYDILDRNTRQIKLLIYARMSGGEFAKRIISKQIFWGANTGEIRKKYEDAINNQNEILKGCLGSFIVG